MTSRRRKVNGAVNRATLSARARAWERAHKQAVKNGATRCKGKYVWLRLIAAAPLASTTKLVAHTLALHGRVNGRSIHPSTRTIARESSLSERAVCTHLDKLVRSGRLWRSQRDIGRKWALTIYTLCAPKRELIHAEETPLPWQDDPTWKPAPDVRGAEPRSAPDKPQGTERRSARPSTNGHSDPDEDAHRAEPDARGTEPDTEGTERGAEGTERRAGEVQKDVLSSLSSGVSHRSSSQECASQRTAPVRDELKEDHQDQHPHQTVDPATAHRRLGGREKIEKLMRLESHLGNGDIALISGEPLELVVEVRRSLESHGHATTQEQRQHEH